MKFYIANAELDSEIAEIRRTIRLSMNGIVSDQMTNSGIIYKKNYGVSIPRIKEIAKKYSPNHDLAQRLWLLQIRETMIMATLLEPIDKFSPELAQEWVESFNQIEIIEQSCMNLFSRLSFSTFLSIEWISSKSSWLQTTGYVLAARVYKEFDKNQTDFIIQKAIEISGSDDFHLYKAVSLCLSRLCRTDKRTAIYILSKMIELQNVESEGQKYIISELKQEMLFLEIL